MEPYHGSWVLPTGPRDGGQGRRQVSPVWWCSDDSSYFVSGLDERLASDFFDTDEICHGTIQQEQSVQTEALNSSKSHTAKAEPGTMSFSNRLRRRAASDCLSAQYLESGGCSTHESREAGAVEQQTIRPTVATQGTIEGTNHRARRSFQLSADMNQPELVKISSGLRRDNAQTVAPTLEAGGLWDERDDSTGQRDAHKADGGTDTSTEDACTRSSIASEEATSTVCIGTITTNVGFVQQLEAPNVSPQRAEFLNVHSNGVRHESLLLPARRDLSNHHNRVEEQSNLRRLKSMMTKYDSKVKAHLKVKQRPQRRAMMRPDVASREALIDHGVRLTKIPNSRSRRKPLGPREMPRDSNSMRLRGEEIPAYLFLGGNGDNRGRRFEQLPLMASSPSEARPSRGKFEVGQAQAVSFSKPGKASLVKITPQKSKSFDLGALGLVETEILFSAGAVARSARRTNMRTEGTRPRSAPSAATDGATDAEPLLRGHQKSRIPRAIPETAEHTVRRYKRSICGSQTDMDRDVRFPQLVRRLKTNAPLADEDAGRASVPDSSQLVALGSPASEQRSAANPRNDRWTTGRIQSSFPKQEEAIHLSLQEDPCQSQIHNEDDSAFISPSKTVANPNPPPGNSGCPSLISDDGQEPFEFSEAVVDKHAQLPIFQRPPGTIEWQKEEGVSTAVDETSSEGSSTLVHISVNDSGLLSAADTEAIHDENIRADEIHAGVGTSSHSEHGRGSLMTRAIAPAISFHHGNHDAGSDAQRRGGMSARVPRPDELTLYPLCAILRWLVSTTDAPGTPGMWHESSEGLELFVAADEYELIIDDEIRADLLRMLRCLSGAAELPPDPYAEVWAFIRNMYPPSML